MFKSQLIVLDGTLNAARYTVVVPLVQWYNLTFQQDNARPHVARICQNFLTAQNIQPFTDQPTVQIYPLLSISGMNWTGESEDDRTPQQTLSS